MNVRIRPVTTTDKAQWQSLFDAYQHFYERPNLPQRVFDTIFSRLLNDDPRDFHGLVADRDGQLMGLTHYVFHPNLRHSEGVCYLQDLFTRPDARGQGIGRALIEAVYAAADAEGVPNVYWLTQEFNYAGRMLYDRVAVKSPFIRYNRSV